MRISEGLIVSHYEGRTVSVLPKLCEAGGVTDWKVGTGAVPSPSKDLQLSL